MKLNYFNFKQYGKSILMTNDFGKYMFVSKEDFGRFLLWMLIKNLNYMNHLLRKR